MLAGLYPALFFISNNSHIFSLQQNIILTVFTSAIAVIVCLSLSTFSLYAYRFFRKVSGSEQRPPGDRSEDNISTLIITNASLIICFYLLRNTLLSFDMGLAPLVIALLVVAIILSFIVHKRGLKTLFNIFLIFTVLSAGQLSMNIFNKQRQLVDEFVPNMARGIYEKLRFKKKPNVYLVITESYPNKTALREIYGIENSSFYEDLEGLGFGINHNYFSNYNVTLSSLPSMFAMEHHYGLINFGNMDSTGGRRMIELTSYNPTVNAFRNNGYKINYFHNVAGVIPNGAKADYVFPAPSLFRATAVFLTHQKLMEPTVLDQQEETSLEFLNEKIIGVVSNETPSFNFIYYHQPNHSPSRIRSNVKAEVNQILAEFRKSYVKTIEKENVNLKSFCESIIERDKNSIIILTGDHGSWGYRIGEDAYGRRIPYPLYILDRFGILAGIYAPKNLSALLSNGTIKSHVNLFKYVFAFLSEDDKILKTLRPDHSYDGSLIMSIKDNQILKRPVKVTFKNNRN